MTQHTVDDVMKGLAQDHADGKIASIIVMVIDDSGFPSFGISPMSNERLIWMADTLMQKARDAQAV